MLKTELIARPRVLDEPVRRIAVLRALYLGDMLCATPALRELRRRFPAAEITLIGLPWVAELVERLPYIDRLLPFPGYAGLAEGDYQPARTGAFLREARAYGYDLAVQMHGDGSISNGFVADIAARATLGYRSGADERLTDSLPYQPAEHEVLRWLRLVEHAPRSPDTRLAAPDRELLRLDFPLLTSDRLRAGALLPAREGGPLVALHAGAKDMARRWPVERFAALGDALAERYGAQVLLTGSAAERPITAAVREAMRHPARDLAGETDLGELAGVLGRLDLLASNDTGAAHMAVALGTPSVIMYSAGRPAQWAPLDRQRHWVIDAWDFAAPGERARAMERLPLEPVLAACGAILGASGRTWLS